MAHIIADDQQGNLLSLAHSLNSPCDEYNSLRVSNLPRWISEVGGKIDQTTHMLNELAIARKIHDALAASVATAQSHGDVLRKDCSALEECMKILAAGASHETSQLLTLPLQQRLQDIARQLESTSKQATDIGSVCTAIRKMEGPATTHWTAMRNALRSDLRVAMESVEREHRRNMDAMEDLLKRGGL